MIRNQAILLKGVEDGTFLGDVFFFFFLTQEMWCSFLIALKSKNIKHEGRVSGATENVDIGFLVSVLGRI